MKRIILSAAIVSFLSFAASAQQTATVETKTDVQSFLELKAKTEYSSKYCTAVNLIALCVMDNSRADELFTITSTWLYGAIAFSSKARSNYVFKEYAKRASYTQVSALINEFKEFQNDYCYKVYLDMQPDQIDLQWLKLQVKDTAMSNLFANR